MTTMTTTNGSRHHHGPASRRAGHGASQLIETSHDLIAYNTYLYSFVDGLVGWDTDGELLALLASQILHNFRFVCFALFAFHSAIAACEG